MVSTIFFKNVLYCYCVNIKKYFGLSVIQIQVQNQLSGLPVVHRSALEVWARFFRKIAVHKMSTEKQNPWAIFLKNEHPKGFGEWKIPQLLIKSKFVGSSVGHRAGAAGRGYFT